MITPYKAICLTPSIWAVWVATIGNYFAGQLLGVFMPTFCRTMLGYSVESSSRYESDCQSLKIRGYSARSIRYVCPSHVAICFAQGRVMSARGLKTNVLSHFSKGPLLEVGPLREAALITSVGGGPEDMSSLSSPITRPWLCDIPVPSTLTYHLCHVKHSR